MGWEVSSRVWDSPPPSFLQGHVSPSLLVPEVALLNVPSLGLTDPRSFTSTVNTRGPSDDADTRNCLVSFLLALLCLCASWEINAQKEQPVYLWLTRGSG